MSCFDLRLNFEAHGSRTCRHFGSILLKYFIFTLPPTPMHAQHPPSPSPLLPLYSAHTHVHYTNSPCFWGWADSSYPKNTENVTKGHVIDSENDPSVEMRSLNLQLQSKLDHGRHKKTVQNDPTYTEETGEKKCAALRSAQARKLCSDCD